MSLASQIHDLRLLTQSFHPAIALETPEEKRATDIVISVANRMRVPCYEFTLTRGLLRLPSQEAVLGIRDLKEAIQHIAQLRGDKLFILKDIGNHLDDDTTARHFRELKLALQKNASAIFLIAPKIRLPDGLKSKVVFFDLPPLESSEILETLKKLVGELKDRKNIKIDITKEDLQELVQLCKGLTLHQIRQSVTYSILKNNALSRETLALLSERKAEILTQGGLLEFYPTKDQKLELGGFNQFKEWTEKARLGFSEKAKAMNLQPPKGVLIVGVPGSGKSLAAKVLSSEWRLPLLKLDSGQLYDKYIGETEKNFERATKLAESMSPVILWIDELEKAMPSTDAGSADGGVGKRLFGRFLTWLQEKEEGVFVIATANKLDELPPELLRKGRFDEIFFADLPADEARQKIFEIHLRLRNLDPADFRMTDLVEKSSGFTGAEIEQVVLSSCYDALHRDTEVETDSLLEAIRSTTPLSVTRKEDIEMIRDYAKTRFRKV